MTTTTTTTRTKTARRDHRNATVRTGFFTGRGDTSTLRGVLTAATPSPPPDPGTLATLPVGRALLSATTDHGFHTALAELLIGWHAAGFGGGTTDLTDPQPDLTCPPPDGDHDNRWDHPCYTVDDGQVLYCIPNRTHATPHGGQWHTVTLAAGGRPRVDLVPASRLYGETYPDTAALDLAGVAVWIMAELTRLGRADGSAVWPQVRYAAAVNTTLDHIRLYLYGLDDAPGTRHAPTERDRDAFDELTTVATAHSWTNPHNPADHRFRLHTHVVTPHQVPDLHDLGRTPGTVTVVADPNPFWT